MSGKVRVLWSDGNCDVGLTEYGNLVWGTALDDDRYDIQDAYSSTILHLVRELDKAQAELNALKNQGK